MNIDRKTVETFAQHYVKLANQFRADAPKQALVNFFHGPIHPVEPGMLELQNATVLAGGWFVTAGGMALS